MKVKIKRYIKKAEGFFLEGKAKGYTLSVKILYQKLDMEVIPVCSMTKEDQKELKDGLEEMVKKHNSQLTIF